VFGRFFYAPHKNGEFQVNLFDRIFTPFYFEGESGAGGGTGTPPPGEQQAAPKTYDEAYVTALRNEAASYRVKAKETGDKLKTFEDAQKTDTQKLQERAEAAERERDTLKGEAARSATRAAFADVATEAKAKNPGTVAKLLAIEKIKGADEGKPDVAETRAALEAIRKSDPDLFQKIGPLGSSASGGAGSGGAASTAASFNQFVRNAARR
jgi:hypothetical protein